MGGLTPSLCQKYADSVAENSDNYGRAISYYARAHNASKVKNVLNLLVSYCLVHSMAFPPASELDPYLSSLLLHPRDSIRTISAVDPEAAVILQTNLGGYFTLRKFYDLRDQDIYPNDAQKPKLRPKARNRAAVAALTAVIASAASSIRGGLYDADSDAVIHVDVLLSLLGEATVFIDQPQRTLTLPQILTLLRAIEDLQTVHSRIMSKCDECLQTTLEAARGTSRAASPQGFLKKSVSSLTSGSGFSLVGSSMVDKGGGRKGRSGGAKHQRSWDWRKCVSDGMRGEELLRMMRRGLAKDIARAWIEGEGT